MGLEKRSYYEWDKEMKQLELEYEKEGWPEEKFGEVGEKQSGIMGLGQPTDLCPKHH